MKDLASGTSIKLTDGSSIKVKKELGRGGQGVVYLVDYNGKDMALKWYHNPPSMFSNALFVSVWLYDLPLSIRRR